MYNSFDNNEVLRCPYNKHHVISKFRFQRHLVKCEKNYPSDYMCICPYNATHRFSKNEIEEHIKTCSTRNIVEGSYIQPSTSHDTVTSPKEHDSRSEIDFLESQEETTGFSTTLSTSKLDDENICLSDVESCISYESSMAIGRGRMINYDAECTSDNSNKDVASFSNTMSHGRGRMLNNLEYIRRFGSKGRRN
ncbi:gametocyte-specific factor 1 [Linepithema humile]|uniref:gametocyte-specific factor 1 n=1 Tax=Linepithema humile TaxID=83485 RepID=UPI00062323A5|nr:PREDICTED: gametocyte-specific factor 1 [Linepithema humile]